GRTAADGFDQRVLEELHATEEQIVLRREVVEDGYFRNLSLACDLGDRHGIETALCKEACRRLVYQLSCLLLLPPPQAETRHGARVAKLLKSPKLSVDHMNVRSVSRARHLPGGESGGPI